jgi:hypothetical protein
MREFAPPARDVTRQRRRPAFPSSAWAWDTGRILTLEIIPVIYTYWRNEQPLWSQLGRVSEGRLRRLRIATAVLKGAGLVGTAALVAQLYVAAPPRAMLAMPMVAAVFGLAALVVYLLSRVEARHAIADSEARISAAEANDGPFG